MKFKCLAGGLFVFLAAGWMFGQAWDYRYRMTYTLGINQGVKVATDSNNVVHTVWADDVSGETEIYYKNCPHGGIGTWSMTRRLTWNSGQSNSPDIAIDGDDVIHVVWEDNTPGNDEIYHKMSTDGGATWSAIQRVTSTSAGSQDVSIAVSEDNWVRMAYLEYVGLSTEIYYREYEPTGGVWSSPRRLSYTDGFSTNPWIRVDGQGSGSGYIHVVWEDDTVGDKELYHKMSTDGGDTWSPAERITYSLGATEKPCFVFTSDNILRLVYDDDSSGNGEIYYKERFVSGVWSGLERLTWTPGNTHSPTVAVDADNDIHVVYADHSSGVYNLRHKKSTDGGSTWSAPTRITWGWNANFPRMVVSAVDDNIQLVYIDSDPGNPECHFKRGYQGIIY